MIKKNLIWLLLIAGIVSWSPVSAETLLIKDGAGNSKYLDVDGVGTVGDPHKDKTVLYGTNTVGIEAIKIYDGSIFVHPSPHDAANSSVHLAKTTGTTDTLAVASLKNDQTVTVTNGAQWSVGNKIKLGDITDEANSEYDLLTIKVISTNDLTFDRPLDAAHAIGSTVTGITQNLAVDGSVAPQTFSWTPPTGTKYHVHTVHVIFASATEPSLELFGGNAALTYGMHCEVTRTSGRDDSYWIPIRSMNAMILSGFKYTKEAKVLGGAYYAHLYWNPVEDSSTVINLTESLGEAFQCTIRDDTTGNSAIEIKLSVHESH